MKRLALLAILLMTVTAEAATTIILVRHAEKAPVTGDMPLSDAGIARAKELARVLADARITAIYTTQYRRTRETAAPLAEALKITPEALEAGKAYPSNVVKAIREKHQGGTVLVVGHSNTTPDVLRELGMKEPPFIPESQFDDLFVCTLVEDVTCTALRYGVATRQ